MSEQERHPAILQANRQIYNEASSILYSELQLVVKPGDTELKYYTSVVKGQVPSAVWRHLPSHGLGRKNVNGLTEYNERDMSGAMEPHVFTRFERVRYEADFDFQQDGAAPWMNIEKDLQISAEDESRVIAYFNDPNACRLPAAQIIQHFVTLISRSPLVATLEFAFSVKFPADFDFDELASMTLIQQEVVNKRAYELVLESGVLEPLRKLTNVKRFVFDFVLQSASPRHTLFQPKQPKQKHVDITNDLKAVIEHNWVVEQLSH